MLISHKNDYWVIFDSVGGDQMQTKNPHRLLKERQRQERAELILQVAEAVLAERGYQDASMDEIATRAGIAKGTVYQHFPSKEELVFALFEREAAMFLHEVEQIIATTMTARAKLESILLCAYQGPLGQRSQVFLSRATNRDVHERKRFVEKAVQKHEQMHKYIEHLAALIRTVLEAGKAEGEFDPTISTSIMVATFLGFLAPKMHELLKVQEQLSPEQLVEQIGRLYFQGITSKQ